MKVYNTHHIPPTCFSHSYGHFQGCALKRLDKSKYFNSFILCDAPPCRWPHEWLKHVQGTQHVWCTFIYLRAFAGFATTSNCLVHSYGLFKLSPLHFYCTCIPIALQRMHSQNMQQSVFPQYTAFQDCESRLPFSKQRRSQNPIQHSNKW